MNEPKEAFALVRFHGLSEQLYSYRVPPYITINVGSIVAVEAGDSYGIALVKQVEGILPVQEEQATKYIVDCLDYRISLLGSYKEKCVTDDELDIEDLL